MARTDGTRAKLVDVARAAQVSVSAASRALGGYRDVAPATRERVRKAAATLGYRPSWRARSLVAGKDAPLRCAVVGIGVRPTELGHYFLGPVFAGIMGESGREGMEVQLATSERSEPPADAFRRLIAEDRADGFIVLTSLALTPQDTRPLDDYGVPFVLANRHFGEQRVSCITYAWEKATHDALRRLCHMGHRRVALLLPNLDNTTVKGHEDGWQEGVRALGLPEDDAPVLRYVRTGGGDEENGSEMARALLMEGLPGGGGRPTAIVGFNDWCALGALRGAASAGVDVPGQLSVIGFDNTLLGEASTPRLCSYQPQAFEMGRQAARLLGAHLRKEIVEPQRVVVPVDFVCRASCGPAPAV
ncbi:MAG TPA: LacI family DNA-binding transcriptional regulator [Chloroflexota bacterium]|nr:LacI family DNA-binding transcriptional regulator [Chloroflexota bacterium]